MLVVLAGRDADVTFLCCGKIRILNIDGWDQFSCFRYLLASPDITALTSTKFVCFAIQ
jgi:hypothetical protein